MKDAELLLNKEIDKLIFNDNKINVISNYSANFPNDSKIIKSSLQKQMSNKVRWVESIAKLEESVDTDIEIGRIKFYQV